MAVFRIPGDCLLVSLSFSRQNFLNDSVVIFSLVFFYPFPLFYSVILESRGTIDSPVFPPGYQSAHRLEGWAFPVSHFFSSFWCCFFESPWLTIYFGAHLFLMSRSLWFNFWPSFLFIFFLKLAKSHSVGSKVLCCYFPFYSPLFWFLEVPFICAVRGHSRLSFFLAGSLVPEKDVSTLCFLCSFGFSFELS